MRRTFLLWLHRFVKNLHKKSELHLQDLKKKKLHGTPQYTKVATHERRMRDIKKGLQTRLGEYDAAKGGVKAVAGRRGR